MIHLQRFIDRIQGVDARGLRDMNISLSDAKGMHAELTQILLELQTLRQAANTPASDEVIRVSMDGGSF